MTASTAPDAEGLPKPLPARLREPGEVQLGRLGEFIGFHLRLAQDAVFASFARRVGVTDLTPGHYTILTLLGQNEGLTPTALSRVSGRDKSSITPVLRDLELRGLVRREAVPGDRRSCGLALTGAGESALDMLHVHAAAHEQELDRIVGAGQKALFLEQLRRITVAMARRDPQQN